MEQLNLTDICRVCIPKTNNFTLQNAYKAFFMVDHILAHKFIFVNFFLIEAF